jgi:hypothetical protein
MTFITDNAKNNRHGEAFTMAICIFNKTKAKALVFVSGKGTIS